MLIILIVQYHRTLLAKLICASSLHIFCPSGNESREENPPSKFGRTSEKLGTVGMDNIVYFELFEWKVEEELD
jgi:hypothetical protein